MNALKQFVSDMLDHGLAAIVFTMVWFVLTGAIASVFGDIFSPVVLVIWLMIWFAGAIAFGKQQGRRE